MPKTPTRAKAIRLKCLDCSGSTKNVKWCTLDGVNSTRCPLWPYRFGCGPEATARRYGQEFVTPGALPDADVSPDDCQKALQAQKVAASSPFSDEPGRNVLGPIDGPSCSDNAAGGI